MKFFYSILLLLVTAVYILPVSDIIKESPGISVTDLEDENNTKEKVKEFVSVSAFCIPNLADPCDKYYPRIPNLPVLFHTIEIPPPDNIG